MKLRNALILVASHIAAGVIGFAAGIYVLPILTAPPAPSVTQIDSMSTLAKYSGQFRKDLQGSDFLHWGEGTVSVGSQLISLKGKLAPGPDYKLYLAKGFVETEADFHKLKDLKVRVGDVKTFNNFVVKVPPTINPDDYNTVIVWCESFGEFISAAKYQ